LSKDRQEPEPLWHPARASMIVLTTVVVALLVWLAYAVGWLP
jgi:hypothetical protein